MCVCVCMCVHVWICTCWYALTQTIMLVAWFEKKKDSQHNRLPLFHQTCGVQNQGRMDFVPKDYARTLRARNRTRLSTGVQLGPAEGPWKCSRVVFIIALSCYLAKTYYLSILIKDIGLKALLIQFFFFLE